MELPARRRLQLESLEDRATPAIFTVNTNLDPGPAGTESLRMAITSANAAGANTVNFASSLLGQTIAITGTALPAIANSTGVTITGLGQDSLTISGSNLFKVFDIAPGGNATITDLTITKGLATGATPIGGGIDNNGSLTLMRDTITGNSAMTNGGGIAQESSATSLSISSSTISSNASPGGAGVYLNGASGSSATISNSTITGNTGGGSNIYLINANPTTLTVSDSTISNGTEPGVVVSGPGAEILNLLADTITGNSTSGGGALNGAGLEIKDGASNVNVIDSTIANNTTTLGGGGINHSGTGTLSVFDSTITGNSATLAGGGISVMAASPFIMANSVVALNISGTSTVDVSGTITGFAASGGNFIGGTTGFVPGLSSIVGNGDPMLGPLQNNGGPTQTELPLAGSPLINVGSNTLVPSTVTTDQRGIGRFIGPATPSTTSPVVDVGAVEYQPQLMVVSGQTNGTAQTYTFNAAGVPQAVGSPFTPFPGFNGPVRSVTADVNGDGALDTIYVTGPGTETMVTVISGKDSSVLVPPYDPFGSASNPFTGGGFLAAGDFQGTGKADWVVTPDQGGGPRVVIFSLTGTSVTMLASFFGINDPSFRGGARVAVGDFNGDGTPDLAVAAGFLGGPRVSIYNGLTLFGGTPTNLVPDFFAFGGTDATTLRNGVYLTAGDFNGDGFADLAFGGGPGGGPRVLVISGQLLTGSGGSAAAEATPMANFFAFDQSERGGVWLASKFSTGSNLPTLVAASGVGVAPAINAYLGATLTGGTPPSTTFPSFSDPTEPFGVFVG